MTDDLSENSHAYKKQADIYEQFSQAEDKPGLISDYLIQQVQGQDVLDLGCGNGKYLKILMPHSKSIVGVDKSQNQLAKAKILGVPLLQADCTDLPFQDKSFDVIVSCWMLGTLIKKERQFQALTEMKRVMKDEGKIILIENDVGGEFEVIRGRYPDPAQRTYNYNQFLIKNNFKSIQNIDTFFEFKDHEQAQAVFQAIWKNRLTNKITSSTICHRVVVFEFNKKSI